MTGVTKSLGLRALFIAGLVAAVGTGAHAQWGWFTQQPSPQAQSTTPPPQGVSRGENFSAGKTPAQLFNSDCTGSGCHKVPQGLARDRGVGSLASFLREHYTNSRESAAALAAYLVSVGAGRGQPRAASRSDEKPAERRPPAVVPPAAVSPPAGEAGETQKPPTRQRGRQTTAAPAPAPAPAPAAPPPAPTPPAEPAAAPAAAPAPAPAAPPPEPPKPKWDIFD